MPKPTSAKKLRHAIFAMRSHGAGRLLIAVAILTPSAKRPARFHHLEIDGVTDRVIRDDFQLLSARLRRLMLYHYNQPEIGSILDQALRHAGARPLSGPMIDLSLAAQTALGRRGLEDSLIDLDTLAARHGLSRRTARRAARDPDEAVGLLADLFAPVLHPALASAAAPACVSNATAPTRTRPLSAEDIAILSQDAPLAPDLPQTHPPRRRRRGPWSRDETLDCTLRLRRGASLTDLERLTGRSARAIRAQLLAEGFLRRQAIAA